MCYYPTISSPKAPEVKPIQEEEDWFEPELSFGECLDQESDKVFDGKYKLRDDYQGVDTVSPDVDIMEITHNLVR